MAIDMTKLQQGIGPNGPTGSRPAGSEKVSDKLSDTLSGPRFHDLLREQMPSQPTGKAPVVSEAAKDLEALTSKKVAPEVTKIESSALPPLKFSTHAMDRIRSRGINIAPHMEKITDAVDRAAKKGSKDTLILTGDAALIVNVKNRTVVTAMDRAAMKENVFTNIDSTVMI